jgi:hypothetical protein
MEEEEIAERMKGTPRMYSEPQPRQTPAQPPAPQWPAQLPAPPAYGPWSTGGQQRPPGINGRS